jgi:hypothetical protein
MQVVSLIPGGSTTPSPNKKIVFAITVGSLTAFVTGFPLVMVLISSWDLSKYKCKSFIYQ